MLNADLYNRLKRQFGTVKIIRENEPAILRPFKSGSKIHYRYEGGEEYNCCCPFCNDRGFHLYINYTYGTEGPNGYKMFSAAHCFHGCLDNSENRESLYSILYAFPLVNSPRSVIVPICEEPDKEILPPGKLIPLSQLPPDHPAIQYLVEGRKFSPQLLAYYGVCYCYESDTNPLAVGRIVIPIWFKGEYKGWQTRKIGDGKTGGIKYCTAPGMKKSRFIYNYDIAIQQDHVVICEGVTDVWRVGPSGICLFGKAASSEQVRLIKEGWGKKDICLLLDPDASKETAKLYEKLKSDCINVFVVKLPEGIKDAALMDSDSLHNLIEETRHGGRHQSDA